MLPADFVKDRNKQTPPTPHVARDQSLVCYLLFSFYTFPFERHIKMAVIWRGIVGLLFIITGVRGSAEYPDSAIRCVFEKYSECYRDIASLGANSSVRFDENIFQINETCRYQNKVLQCISSVGPNCVILHALGGVVERTAHLIQQLCSNRTFQQTSEFGEDFFYSERKQTRIRGFLNSSICYNRYQITRSNCVRKFYTTKSDAKSLCCSSLRTQECLRDEMHHVCPKTDTEFQIQVATTFSSHQFAVCGSYMAHCAGTMLDASLPRIIALVVLVYLAIHTKVV